MKTIYIIGLLVLVLSSAAALSMRSRWQKPSKPIGTNKMSFYDLTINSIDGKEMHMSDFKGKYVLCVNVASKCGYTPQYEDLEKLYEQYQGKLVIVGFPCNQFLGQEPGTSEEIVSFCQKNYGVTFPLTEKIDVKGKNQHGVYQWLTQQSLNGVADGTVKWNFHKFLVSPEGEWLAEFPSGVKPLDTELTSLIK
ncbi:MAG: glutathione peroxidase [Flavobacteriales bacterium]|jgi:glutathione peroxidase|nr:glutathione peroxidase [Flavobacteriales bacterium]MDP4716640.1 glutathione peroxidase [Flavobacteriales bacterium]MDP4731447.1 glutathione peroxidase [Flavobacteriales bacterium]MDP4818985.1 glutathione peroxidase [Flavobacteriales bacterium]MDP4951694.1 glutathione peroxidase [Flavobacteriales bacterium]